MSKLTILILSTVLAHIAYAQQLNPCFGAQKTLVANPNGSCEEFFSCVNGKPVAQRCPGGLFFDAARQICNFSHLVNCNNWQPTIGPMPTMPTAGPQSPSLRPPVLPKRPLPTSCRGQPDGLFIPDRQLGCDTYRRCRNGRGTPDRCPSPLFFDFERQMCNWRRLVDC